MKIIILTNNNNKDQMEEILLIVFKYIQLMRKEGPQEQIFKEVLFSPFSFSFSFLFLFIFYLFSISFYFFFLFLFFSFFLFLFFFFLFFLHNKYFKKCQQKGELTFRFKEKEKPSMYCARISGSMQVCKEKKRKRKRKKINDRWIWLTLDFLEISPRAHSCCNHAFLWIQSWCDCKIYWYAYSRKIEVYFEN